MADETVKLIVTVVKSQVIQVEMPRDFDPKNPRHQVDFDCKVDEIVKQFSGQENPKDWVIHNVHYPWDVVCEQNITTEEQSNLSCLVE